MTTQTEALKMALEALERYQVKRQDFERFADVITAIKEALAQEQEPVAWTEKQFFDDGTPHPCSALKWAGRNEQDDFHVGTKFYTTPQTKVGCVECGVSGGHAFYCVACAKKLFGGYKESESFDRTASHMANEYVGYKEPILTDAEISESYYEVFKTAMIDIKAFEFAYSLLRKAQNK